MTITIEEPTLLLEEAPDLDYRKVRLVFLDIDGVINSYKTFILSGMWPNLNVDYELTQGYHGGPKSKVLKQPYVKHIEGIDKYAVGLLNMLLKSVNAHIVVSSSWREGLDIYQLRDVLAEMGIDPTRVIGKTSDVTAKRGEQIFNFLQGVGEKRFYAGPDFFVAGGRLIRGLSKIPLNVESYVILDDKPDFLPGQVRNFVRTEDYNGLSLEDTLLAGSVLLGGKDFEIPQLQNGEDYQGKLILGL